MSFTGWLTDILPGHEEKRRAELGQKASEQQTREAGRKDETYWGTNEPVKDDSDVTVKQPGANTTEKKEESGWSFISDTWKRVSGQTTTNAGTDKKTGEASTVTSTSGSSTTVTPGGAINTTTDNGSTTVKVVDVKAMAKTAADELTARSTDPNTTDEDRLKLQAQIAQLNNPALDEAQLKQIVVDGKLQIRAQYKTTVAASNTSTSKADVLSGTASQSEATSRTTANADGTFQKKAQTDTTSVTTSQGASTVNSSKETTNMQTNAAGEALNGTKTTDSKSGALLGGANGHGVQGGESNQKATTETTIGPDGKPTTSTTTNGSEKKIGITDKGVVGSASQSSQKLTNGTNLQSAKVSADGSFTIEVTEVAGSQPPQYQVVFTVSAGAAAEAKRARIRDEKLAAKPGERSTTASATASVGLGAQLVFTHVMEADEARQYMTNVDKIEAGGGVDKVKPEFGVLGKLKALKESGGVSMGAVAAMGGSEAGAALKEGESVDMTLSLDAKLGGSVGHGNAETGSEAKSASAEIGASGGVSRKLHISRSPQLDAKGHHMVDVTVTFVEKADWKASGSVSAEGATFGKSHAEGGSKGNGATVRLDCDAADYADKFQRVTLATTVEQIRDLATQFQKTETTTESNSVSVGAAGATLTLGNTQAGKDDVNIDRNKNRVLGTEAGSNADQVGLSAGTGDKAIKGVQDNTTRSAETKVDDKGMETNVETKEEKTDIVRSVKEGAGSAWGAVTGLFSSDKTKEKKATDLADLATTSPQEKLKAQLETTYADLERYQLFESDIETLVQRAGDQKSWQSCNSSPYYMQGWESFRLALRMPPIKTEEAAVNAVDARRLGLGRAMADNMKAGGGRATSAIEVALRHWKSWLGEKNQVLGVHWEWPESMKASRVKYEEVHARSRAVDDYLAGFSGKKDSESRGLAWKDDTQKKFDEVKAAIVASNDVEPHAKGEMINQIMKEKEEVDVAWDRHLPALKSGAIDTNGTKDAKADPTTEKRIPTAEETNKHLWRRLTDITQLIGVYKSQETQAYARARAILPKSQGGEVDTSASWGRGTYRAFFNTNANTAQDILSEIANKTHPDWIASIKELRGVYGQLQMEPEKWIVTQQGQTPRKMETEPDIATLVALRNVRNNDMDLSLGARQQESAEQEKNQKAY